MLRTSTEYNRALALGLFFICFMLILFSLGVEALFPYYAPIFTNPLYQTPFSYVRPSAAVTAQPSNASAFSYQDYYAAYPYLQQQGWTTSSYGNGTVQGNTGSGYVTNGLNYSTGFTGQSATGIYKPPTLATLSSSTYQTVSNYAASNTINQQYQTGLAQAGTYNPQGAYLPAAQNGYYAPSQQSYYPYQGTVFTQYTQNQPTVYYPAGTYTTSQTNSTGYYYPNSNYWPNSQITMQEPPVDIAGLYRGAWVSDTTGSSKEIWADIDQTDAQVQGQIKLMGYIVETKGKTSVSGTVNGNTVSLDVNLNGSVLKVEGTVQDSGEIVGTYSVTGSSGSIIDEGSITFEPR